jgi:hypothetical protein
MLKTPAGWAKNVAMQQLMELSVLRVSRHVNNYFVALQQNAAARGAF